MGRLLFALEDVRSKRFLRPDGKRAALASRGIEPMPVGRRHVIVLLHPGPAAYEIGAIIVETDILKFTAPAHSTGVGPANHGHLAVGAFQLVT